MSTTQASESRVDQRVGNKDSLFSAPWFASDLQAEIDTSSPRPVRPTRPPFLLPVLGIMGGLTILAGGLLLGGVAIAMVTF